MMLNQQLEDDMNTGSEPINSSEDEPTLVSPLLERELQVIVNQKLNQIIDQILTQKLNQTIETILETMIRRVVKEQFESAQETILSIMNRNSSNEIHPSESRILQLRFLNKPSPTVLTGDQIEGEGCTSIKVVLIDCSTRKIVSCGPESSAKVEIVVLEGGFNDVEGHGWTLEEFNQKIVRKVEGKNSLLRRDAYLNLKEGVGTVSNISFTHNSNWMKTGEFRLGARVVDNFSPTRVREAISESFELKDCRSKLYEKHYPPHLSDEVWRLEKIAKDGKFHERLTSEKITNVKEFLTLFFTNPQRLQDIIRAGKKTLEIITNHAQTCIPDKEVHLYCPDSQQRNGVIFSGVGQLMGRLLECQFVPLDTLSETEKADAHKLVVSAFEHWEDVIPFEDIPLKHAWSQTHPPNSLRLENPSAHNSGTRHMINENDDMQPSTSSPAIIPPIHPIGNMNNIDVSDYPIDDMELSYQDFDMAVAYVCATAVAHVPIRWRKVFIVLHCVKPRSIVRSNHVQKRPRCC